MKYSKCKKLQLIHKLCNCHSYNTAIRHYITIRNYMTWLITLNFNVCVFTAGLHKTVYKMYYKIFYNFHMICIMEYYWILCYWWNTNIYIYIYIYNVDATSFIGHRRSRHKIIIILLIAIFLNVAVIARCSQQL